MSNHGGSRNFDGDAPECYCDAVRGDGGRHWRHYHCSGCDDAFYWDYLLLNRNDKGPRRSDASIAAHTLL